MNGVLNNLYGFDELGFGTPGAECGWALAPSPWVWALVVIAAAGLGAASYARVRMHSGARVAAGVLRSVLLLGLVVLALGPRLERPRTRVERRIKRNRGSG